MLGHSATAASCAGASPSRTRCISGLQEGCAASCTGRSRANSLRIPRRIVQVFTAICYRRRRSFRETEKGNKPGRKVLCVGRLTPRMIRSPPGNGFGSLCILAGTVALYCSFCTQNFSRGLLFPSLWPSRRQGSPLWADLHSSRTCASCCASGKASTSTMIFCFLKCRTSNLC